MASSSLKPVRARFPFVCQRGRARHLCRTSLATADVPGGMIARRACRRPEAGVPAACVMEITFGSVFPGQEYPRTVEGDSNCRKRSSFLFSPSPRSARALQRSACSSKRSVTISPADKGVARSRGGSVVCYFEDGGSRNRPEPSYCAANVSNTGDRMSRFRDRDDLIDRQSNSAAAKKAMLEKFRAAANDPEIAARRSTIEAERLARRAERFAAGIEREAERAEQFARDAEIAAKAKRETEEAEAVAAAELAEREATLKAEQKAARDVRYAARKAAKKERRRGY